MKAFDSVHRDSLWDIARSYGIPSRFVDVFRNLYLDSSCCVRTENGTTSYFPINTGVRQGCVLSPFLFNMALDSIMRKAMGNDSFGIVWQPQSRLTDLDFADDIALIGATKKGLQDMTTSLGNASAKVGLKISATKSKVMRIGYATANAPIQLGQQQIEEVEKFTYLGSVLSNDGNSDHDVLCRLGKAMAVFQQMRPIWSISTISMATKIRLLSSIIIPIATYACETWKGSSWIAKRLDVFQQRCLRRILHISYLDRVTNVEVLRRTGLRPLQQIVTERRVRFAGHVLRLPPTRHAQIAMNWAPPRGKRKQGRPKTTWRRTFIDDLRSVQLSLDEAAAAASNRAQWRITVAQCAERRRWN